MSEIDLSVIVPVYNEENFLVKQLDNILDNLPEKIVTEVIVVNDGSTDSTTKILERYQDACIVVNLPSNQGKGSAVINGLKEGKGKVVMIIDSDLEYSPKETFSFIDLVLADEKVAVYGNRMHRGNPIGHHRYFIGNLFLSALTSLLYNRLIRDVETGCKVLRRCDIAIENLSQKGFGIEIELTVELIKKGVKIKQPKISYFPRRFSDGKKINWKDGIRAIYLLFKLRFSSRTSKY